MAKTKKAKPVKCAQCKSKKATAIKEVFWIAAGEYIEIPVCEKCNRTG
jgi:protein-arginine kinase activator protein McsA